MILILIVQNLLFLKNSKILHKILYDSMKIWKLKNMQTSKI